MSVSLNERQRTFGASSLSQMTRGNKVPNGPSQNAGVPTALPLALSQLNGAVAASSLSGNVSTTSVSGSRSTAGVASSTSVTASGAGGSGTYSSFTWHITTTLGNTITAAGPTSATTNFTATVNNSNPEANGNAYCTIVDSSSNTANTPTVAIALTYTGP